MKNNNLVKVLGLLLVIGVAYSFFGGSTPANEGVGSQLLIPVLGSVRCEAVNNLPGETIASTQKTSSILVVDNQYDQVTYQKLMAPAGHEISCPNSYTPAGDWIPRTLNGKKILLQYNQGSGNWVTQKQYNWWIGNLFQDPVDAFAGTFSMKNVATTQWQLSVQCGYSLQAVPLESATTWIDANNARDFKFSWTAQVKRWTEYRDGAPITQSSDNGCKLSTLNSISDVANAPKDSLTYTIVSKASSILNTVGIQVPSGGGNQGDISKITDTTYANIGEGWNFIDRWTTAPLTYNVKSYNGQSVYCFTANNKAQLYTVTSITVDGQTSWLPSTGIPGAECCNDGDCVQSSRLCDSGGSTPTFKCVDKPQCSQDIECQAMCKDQWTYRSSSNDYLHQMGSGTCSSSKCACATEVTKCASGTCPQGMTCNLVKNTQNYGTCIGPKSCPSGYWCEQGSGCIYQPASCTNGTVKCNTDKSPCLGKCLTSCPIPNPGCVSNTDCDDNNPKTIDSCIHPLIGSAYCDYKEKDVCATDSDCDDSNTKTIDKCVSGILSISCQHYPTQCKVAADCSGTNTVCNLDSNGAGTCINMGCAKDTDCQTGQICTVDQISKVGKCEAEKTCAEKFSIVTSPTSLLDCYIQQIFTSVTKFVITLTLLGGGAYVTSQLTRKTFKAKDSWKHVAVSVIVGVIMALIYLSM